MSDGRSRRRVPALPESYGLAMVDVGISARLIIRTALISDRLGFVEVLLAAFPDLLHRAFGKQVAKAPDALLRVASEPFPDGVLWVAALDSEIVGVMQVSTLRTPALEIFKLLGIFGGYVGFFQALWATMTLNPFLSKPSELGLYLNYLAIHPDYQRHGIGRAMLSRAIELTMYEGYPQTMTWLPASSSDALDLHQELGFGIRKTYRSTLLKQLVGEGTWHYLTRPAAVPIAHLKPVIERAAAP